MPRRQPPVYTPILFSDLRDAAKTLWNPTQRHRSTVLATALLQQLYPERSIALTSSGTSALRLALEASSNGDHKVVALPAYACPDVGAAAIGAGFQILLYDVDPDTFEPELGGITTCIASGATHVVVTHLCGRITDIDKVKALTEGTGVVLIEDAAQHAGGSLRGQRAGALADLSVLSFGRGKGLNASGGGALLWSNRFAPDTPKASPRDFRSNLRSITRAGITSFLSNPGWFWLPSMLPGVHVGETNFHYSAYPRCMNSVEARLLTGAIRAEREQLFLRQQNELFYESSLCGSPKVRLIQRVHETVSGALRFPARFTRNIARSLLHLGVTRLYPRTLADYPQIHKHLLIGPFDFPGAATLAATLHTLPTHMNLSNAERNMIVRRILG